MDIKLKIVLFGVLPWLLSIAVTMYLIVPTFGSLFALYEDLDIKKDDLNTLNEQISMVKNTKKIDREIADLNSVLSDFKVKIPEEKELDVLYVDIEKFSRGLNLPIMIINIKPQQDLNPDKFITDLIFNPKSKKGNKKKKSKFKEPEFLVKSVPIEIVVSGDFIDIMKMLSNMYYYNRLISVQGVEVQLPRDSSDGNAAEGELTLIVKGRVYYAKDLSPVILADKDKGQEEAEKAS